MAMTWHEPLSFILISCIQWHILHKQMISPFWHFIGVYFIGYHLLLCIYHGKWGSVKINHFSLLFNTAGEEKRGGTNSKNWQLRTFSKINLWQEVALHTKIHFLKSLHTTVVHIDYLFWKSNMSQTSSSLYLLLILTCKHMV